MPAESVFVSALFFSWLFSFGVIVDRAASARHLYFVYLLGGKTYLADDIALGLGEAVEEMIAVAEGDHVAYLIEIKVGVYGVRAKWLMLVVKLSVAALEDKAVPRVTESALAHTVEFVVGERH